MIKYLAPILFVTFLSTSAQAGYDRPKTENYTQKELLKNWAMSWCLAKVAEKFGSKDAEEDAFQTASGYLEYSNLNLDYYDHLKKIVDKYVSITYSSSTGSSLHTMKCIDLYNSKELNDLATDLAKHHTEKPH